MTRKAIQSWDRYDCAHRGDVTRYTLNPLPNVAQRTAQKGTVQEAVVVTAKDGTCHVNTRTPGAFYRREYAGRCTHPGNAPDLALTFAIRNARRNGFTTLVVHYE